MLPLRTSLWNILGIRWCGVEQTGWCERYRSHWLALKHTVSAVDEAALTVHIIAITFSMNLRINIVQPNKTGQCITNV